MDRLRAVMHSFDRWAEHYNDSALQPAYQAAHDAVLCRVAKLTSRPGRILDVGCGTGRLLQTTADRFPSSVLVGVDLSLAMLAVAGRDDRLHCVQAAAERLPFADGSFDLVMTNASFRHWVDQCQAMGEIGRVLKPTGVVGIADLFAPLRAGLIARWTRRVWLPAPLAMALDAAGLVVLGADSSAGPGPLGAITVVVARRRSPRRSRVGR